MKKIVFMGTPDFSVPILNTLVQSEYQVVLVVTQPDKPKGRKKTLTPSPVKTAAIEAGIPVYQPNKLKTDYNYIFSFKPDLIVTAAYGQILPVELLENPEFGCINVHASLLPKLRGGAPIHHAILRGESETGITIMYMAQKLDAGDILSQKAIPITDEDDVGKLHDKLSTLGAECLAAILPAVFSRRLQPIAQDDDAATFAANIHRHQEKIDWTKDHKTVYNQIRGLAPWPVAYTLYQDSPIKIWRAERENTVYQGEPGDIVSVHTNGFTVMCGDNKGIRVLEMQPAGKKRMAAGDYLKGMTNTMTDMKLGD